jgi:hypothetical protein
MKSEQLEFACVVKNFRSPAVRLGGGFDITQHGANVNGLAVVTAVIFTEPLHFNSRFWICDFHNEHKSPRPS